MLSFLPSSETVQAGLCQAWLGTLKAVFVAFWLICLYSAVLLNVSILLYRSDAATVHAVPDANADATVPGTDQQTN